MSTLQVYIQKYGDDAGPKLYRAQRSRAAYIGVARRRGLQIEAMEGRGSRGARREAAAFPAGTPLFPDCVAGQIEEAPKIEVCV